MSTPYMSEFHAHELEVSAIWLAVLVVPRIGVSWATAWREIPRIM